MLAILTTWYRQGLVVGGLESGKLLTLLVSGPSERVQLITKVRRYYPPCIVFDCGRNSYLNNALQPAD